MTRPLNPDSPYIKQLRMLQARQAEERVALKATRDADIVRAVNAEPSTPLKVIAARFGITTTTIRTVMHDAGYRMVHRWEKHT